MPREQLPLANERGGAERVRTGTQVAAEGGAGGADDSGGHGCGFPVGVGPCSAAASRAFHEHGDHDRRGQGGRGCRAGEAASLSVTHSFSLEMAVFLPNPFYCPFPFLSLSFLCDLTLFIAPSLFYPSLSLRSLLPLSSFLQIALHGGPGEDGTLQSLLQSASVPFTGSDAAASATCIDKQETAAALTFASHLEVQGIDTAPKAVLDTEVCAPKAVLETEVCVPTLRPPPASLLRLSHPSTSFARLCPTYPRPTNLRPTRIMPTHLDCPAPWSLTSGPLVPCRSLSTRF